MSSSGFSSKGRAMGEMAWCWDEEDQLERTLGYG